jgi:predicted small lipoprotein YifL
MNRRLVMLLAATLWVAGCGQKGPLYLPDSKKKSNVPPAAAPNAAPPASTAPPAPTPAPDR